MPRNIMVDLETLGTVPGCAILSIGAVEFDLQGVTDTELYEVIHTPTCLDVFLTISAATQKWWDQQEPDAKQIISFCNDPTKSRPLRDALEIFTGFARSLGDDVLVWGNGSDFDNAILAVAYEVCGYPLPWKFWNNRCYRTLKNMHPDIKLDRIGTYHNALDDARTQAEHAVRLLQRQEELLATAGEGVGAALQQEGAARPESDTCQADPARNRVSRQNVSAGIRV